ncbi:MAG TPA: hypothetical protein VJL29_06470 [Thermoguttaceae bacterium]|nr:hypothetical protein [Thermoguttaceae bacterium]
MREEDEAARLEQAAAEFDRHENRNDATRVAGGLSAGLTLLRNSFYQRLYDDVRKNIGSDSMLALTSARKSKALAKMETEIYQIAESRMAIEAAGYVADADWYARWLLGLRLGPSANDDKVAARIAYYTSKPDRDRRLAFGSLLARIIPQSRRVPLILFQLFPLSVHITTAVAFGDQTRAAALRKEQVAQLPAILDCHDCHGALLDNTRQCPHCANPLWTWEILSAI